MSDVIRRNEVRGGRLIVRQGDRLEGSLHTLSKGPQVIRLLNHGRLPLVLRCQQYPTRLASKPLGRKALFASVVSVSLAALIAAALNARKSDPTGSFASGALASRAVSEVKRHSNVSALTTTRVSAE